MALCANDSMSLEKKRRQLDKTMPDENINNISQSDISLKKTLQEIHLTTKQQ